MATDRCRFCDRRMWMGIVTMVAVGVLAVGILCPEGAFALGNYGDDCAQSGCHFGSEFTDCLRCHDSRNDSGFIVGVDWPQLDIPVYSVTVHAALDGGDSEPNRACYACHTGGVTPSNHPSAPGMPPKLYCADCHQDGTYSATVIADHTSSEVVAGTDPWSESCLACHSESEEGVRPNDHRHRNGDAYDVPNDEVNVLYRMASHYVHDPERSPPSTPWGDPDCLFCHDDAANAADYGSAPSMETMLQSIEGHPDSWTADGGVESSATFTYQDLQDAEPKHEGGYFELGTTSSCTVCHDWESGLEFHRLSETVPMTLQGAGPHGGYDTSTNKCKVCHAVHRAEGAYYLLRADSQDDACDYCHIGGSAHSSLVVYDDGKYTTNGHTIGAQSEIPDSSVDQWTEQVTLETTDADGDPVSETIMVRAYDEAKNQMYRFTRHHGHGDWGTGSAGYGVVGPLALRCMNCHQTHNASAQVWRPAEIEAEQTVAFGGGSVASGDRGDGYKLLKRFPAGSTVGTANSYGLYEPGQVVKVPETTLTAGFNYSTSDSAEFTYTEYADGEFAAPIWVAQHIGPEAGDEHGADRDADSINEAALSVWCADCHNLNIGGADMLENEELGFKAHTERTHPAPFVGAYTGPGQCYSCHRSDGLAPVMGGTYDGVTYPSRGAVSGCTQCHYGTSDYYFNRMNPVTAIDSDFPHSGGADSIKLLGSYSVDPEDPTTIDTTTVITSENLDAVCLRCHGGIGSNH